MDLFYDRLPDHREKSLYRQIDTAVGRHLPSFSAGAGVPVRRLRTICRYVALDHPEFFWFAGDFSLSGNSGGPQTLCFEYPAPYRDLDRVDRAIGEAVREIGADRFPDPETRARAVYDWFLDSIGYDLSAADQPGKDSQTVYSVFVRKKSLCLGIARAIHLILRLYGVDSLVVLGRLCGEDRCGHAWNLVKTGSGYRHMDVTVAYPCFREMWTRCHGSPDPCFLVTDDFLRTTHRITDPAVYPPAGR